MCNRIISKIVIVDQTFILYVPTRDERTVLVFEGNPTPTIMKTQRRMENVMYTVFFRSIGPVKLIKLDGQKTITTKWYTTKCLPEILEIMNVIERMFYHWLIHQGIQSNFLNKKASKWQNSHLIILILQCATFSYFLSEKTVGGIFIPKMTLIRLKQHVFIIYS